MSIFGNILSAQEREQKFGELLALVQNGISDPDRKERLIALYEARKEDITTAPASGRVNFHNAYMGGYVDHVLHVVRLSKMMKVFYEKSGGLIDFTDEELLFVALNHDLGKLGTPDEPYYIPQTSDWHRVNKLEVYKHNDDRQYMDVDDMTFFLLQEAGISMTQNEYLGLKLAHGAYSDEARKYFNAFNAGPFPMRTNIMHIIHWADHMACCIEKDSVRGEHTT